MLRVIGAVAWLTLAAVPAQAQPVMPGDRAATNLHWQGHEKLTDWVSTGMVAGALAVPCVQAQDKRGCWKQEGLRVGAGLAINELTKRLVGRERPDKSDRKSFYSMHTSLAITAAVNGRSKVGVGLAVGAGVLRMVAHKHWLSDVLAGAAIGATIGGVR